MLLPVPAWGDHVEIGVDDTFCRPPTANERLQWEVGALYHVLDVRQVEDHYFFYVEVLTLKGKLMNLMWVSIMEDSVGRLFIGDGTTFLLVVECKET